MLIAREVKSGSCTYAADLRTHVADYEISGDSYDPVVRKAFGQGFVFDARALGTSDENACNLELRFQVLPQPCSVSVSRIGTHTIL